MMCRILRVSRAGYYAWRNRRPSKHAGKDAEILSRMTDHHTQSRMTYGGGVSVPHCALTA